MRLKYSRRGGSSPPPDREELELEADGTFSLWRSVGWATQPPTPIGCFKGQLDTALNTLIQQEINRASLAGNLEIPLEPDSPLETIKLEGAELKLGIHDLPAGAWAALIIRLRSLLGELTVFPQAAISLEVTSDGRAARLYHLGAEQLQLNLQSLTVRAVLWQDFNVLGDWHATSSNTSDWITTSKNWSLDVPFQHGFGLKPGYRVAAYVNFEVLNGDEPVQVSLEASSL